MVSIEDSFDQDDEEVLQKCTARVGIQVVRGDLMVTNPKWIAKVVAEREYSYFLLKVNHKRSASWPSPMVGCHGIPLIWVH